MNVERGAKWPPTLRPSQTTWAVNPPVGCQSLHSPSPFVTITQPESWYSFYHHTEGWRISRLDISRAGLPAHRRSSIFVLTGTDVTQLRWSRPTRHHKAKPPTTNSFIVWGFFSLWYTLGTFTVIGTYVEIFPVTTEVVTCSADFLKAARNCFEDIHT